MKSSDIQNQFQNDPSFQQDEPILYSTSKVIFLRKLYLLITLHYFLVYLLVLAITYSDNLQKILQANFWLFVFVIIVLVTINLSLLVLRNRLGHPPLNYTIYLTYTILLSLLLAYFCIFQYTPQVYFIITCCLFISFGLFIYGTVQKIDLTLTGSSLWIIGTVLLVGYWFFLFQQELADTTIILLVISVFIWQCSLQLFLNRFIHVVYDTITPISGIQDYTLLDPVSGCILVYSDVLLLFLHVSDLIKDSLTKEKH